MGEATAARFLEQKGYVVLERNYRFLKAEVDLIAFLPDAPSNSEGEVVFVEVKWRASSTFASPEAAVGHDKRRLLVMAAEAFLRKRGMEGTHCRFDVVAITGYGSRLHIEHYESAFHA